jgi:ribosomal-protein-alanine N-acetyltransferase
MPKLYRRTKNLIIRPLEPKDYKAWREGKLACRPRMNLWDDGRREERELTRSKFQKVINHTRKLRREDRFYDLKIFDRKTGATVGGVALMEVTRGVSHTCFLGYYLYNNYWGRGLAKEAVKSALDIGFKDLKLHRIEAGIEPGNRRSLKLARSLKMRREGVKKRAIHLRGRWVDLVMYTLTTEDVRLKFRGKIGQRTSRR